MGIFSGKTDDEADSDCIVTAVFLGIAMESGKGLKISIEPEDKGGTPDKDLKEALTKANAALHAHAKDPANKFKHTDVTGVIAPDWKPEGSWITGGLKTELDLKTLKDYVEVNKEGGKNTKLQYTGPGAYTGMVFMKDKLEYWGSTFEYAVGGKRKFGTALNKGKPIDNMAQEKGAKIHGYVHGMIQACYVAAKFNSTAAAKVVEVAVGLNTRKMASCFGCSTFMLAVGRQPSHIHLGQAASWVPADEKSEFCLHQLTDPGRLNPDAFKTDKNALKADIARMNSQWRNRISVWANKGAQLKAEHINPDEKYQASWKQVQTVLGKQQLEGAADYYLDALGIYHIQDVKRIMKTLKA